MMNIKELRYYYKRVRVRRDIEACKELGKKLKAVRAIMARINKARFSKGK